MALPANGASYAATLQPNINPTAVRKATVTDLLIKDYLRSDGTVNNLADPSIGLGTDGYFSPFALDGKLRTDLLVNASGTNLGFYHLGGLDESGLEMSYDTKVDPTKIAQSKRPVRYDVTEDNDIITIKAVEATPLIDALRFDLPLSSLKDLGQANYTIAKAAETALVERQVIAFGFDGDHYFAQTYPRMALHNRGKDNWNKNDPVTLEIELGALLCPYVGKPVLLSRDGSSWRGLQGAPVFSGVPTATAVAGAKANVVFVPPTSKSSTFTYMIEKSNDGVSGWTTATTVTVTGTSPLTVQVSGVTASMNWYFRVKATGTNNITTTSSVTASAIVGLT